MDGPRSAEPDPARQLGEFTDNKAPIPMRYDRRSFLRTAAATGALAFAPTRSARCAAPDSDALDAAATRPVLDASAIKSPVIIESVELLRKGKEHFVCVRSKDGAEGMSV